MDDLSTLIIIIFACLIAGVPVGYMLRKHGVVHRIAGKIVGYSVYVLLFILGSGLGANKDLMAQLSEMSYAAVLLTFGAFTGSALAAAVVYKLFFQQKPAALPGEKGSS